MMDLDFTLNKALNEALLSFDKRIKRPDSNVIAQFVIDFMKREKLENNILLKIKERTDNG